MDIVKLQEIVTNTGQFCDRIKESNCVQGNVNVNVNVNVNATQGNTHVPEMKIQTRFRNIVDCIISSCDPMYSIVPPNEQINFRKQAMISIAGSIDEDKVKFQSYGFNPKLMKPNIIQQGLQKENCISSIYFLNEYYKKHFILVDVSRKELYYTSIKDYEEIYLCYSSNKKWTCNQDWQKNTEIDLYTPRYCQPDFMHLDIIVKDIIQVYSSYLSPISKYKLPELQVIANEVGISHLKDNGKSKKKNDLYRDINIHKLLTP